LEFKIAIRTFTPAILANDLCKQLAMFVLLGFFDELFEGIFELEECEKIYEEVGL